LGDNSIRYPLGIAEDVPVKVGHHFIPIDFVIREMGERGRHHSSLGGLSSRSWELPLTLARGKSSLTLTARGVPSSFDHAVCNMIEVKYILPHHRIVKEEPRKKEPPVKTKKMTKPENKPAPKMVQKWVPTIATTTKSIDPK
jgi:hypothetical protein